MKKLIIFLFIFFGFLNISKADFSEFRIQTNSATNGAYTSNCVPNATYTSINYGDDYHLIVSGGGCFRFETSIFYASGTYNKLKLEILNIPNGFSGVLTSGQTPATQKDGGSTLTQSGINFESYSVDFYNLYGGTYTTNTSFALRRIQFNVSDNMNCGIYNIPFKFTATPTTGNEQIFYNTIKINVNSNCVSSSSLSNDKYFNFLKKQNDDFYINYETFTFLLVVILVGLLLMITLIKTFQYGFDFGFFLVTNKKLLGKK